MKKQATNILNLQAKDIISGEMIVKKDNKKKYKGSLDYSLMALKLDTLGKTIFYVNEDKQYTDAVININFDYSSEDYNTKQLRNKIYKDGFDITIGNKNKHFVRFLRSSGSSRQGKCLFIEEKYLKPMYKWIYMGLKIDPTKIIDLASLESYIALITSSIIDTIQLEAKNFLIIDDASSKFTDCVMETRVEKIKGVDRLVTEKNENANIKNVIWDGQSLMDVEIFKEYGYENKGFLLCRNSFFKSCCFNTNIQKFFEDNNITNVNQLRGQYYTDDIKDIKIITTASSLKFLKFGALQEWIDKVENVFGAVKYDKPTHYFGGRKVQSHYQLLQTLHMTEDEVREFMGESIEYIGLLKNDIPVFRQYLKTKIDNDAEIGEINSTNDFMFQMLSINDDIAKTKVFINFRQDVVNSYVKNLKKGHVLIDGNYSTLFGNSWEMLRATIADEKHELYFDYKNINPLLKDNEIHCTNFKYNQKLLCVRSPHVTMGNLLVSNNVDCKVLDTYFNLTRQVVCVNSVRFNSQQRLNGQDLDSDSMLITPQLVEYAEKYYDKFLVPTSAVNPCKKDRYNTPEHKADLDYVTSENLIGDIINCSAVLNGKLWHMINAGFDVNSEEIQDLYKTICTLAILSNIEIDKAKREFSIDSKLELKEIREKYFDFAWIENNKVIKNKGLLAILEEMKALKEDGQDIKYYQEKIGLNYNDYQYKAIKPKFFKFLTEEKKFDANCLYNEYNTTMDYLHKIIKEDIRNSDKTTDTITLLQLLDADDVKISEADRKKVAKIIKEVQDLRKETNEVWNSDLESKEKYIKANNIKNKYIKKITGKLDKATLKKLIHEVCHSDELNGIERKLITILFASNPESFLELFKDKKEEVRYLEPIKKGQDIVYLDVIELYGIQYVVKNA